MFVADERLAPVFADARRQSVEFPIFLANHLPMILIALDRLGVSEDRLRAYPATYRRTNKLLDIELPPSGRIDVSNWQAHLGDRSYELDYRVFFLAEARRLGIDAAIATYLHHLLPGIAGSALHALMRLAYAKMIADTDEVGVALGYWAMVFLPLGDPTAEQTGEPVTEDPIEILVRMHDMPELRGMPDTENDLLWEWMIAVAAKPCFAPVAGWLRVTDASMNRLRQAALTLMATTMTFEALHAVTALHWIRMLDLKADDRAIALRAYWTAIAGVYPKIGLPVPLDEAALDALRHAPCPDWIDIRRKACAASDEHDISFTYSAGEEFSLTGDRLYQVLAAKRVGLIN